MSDPWENWGEYYMSDIDRQQMQQDHDAIARLDGRLSVLERFTGVDGVNGLQQQFRDMKNDMDENFRQVYVKLDAMEEKRQEAAKWRVGTIIAAISSLATLGTLIYMVAI